MQRLFITGLALSPLWISLGPVSQIGAVSGLTIGSIASLFAFSTAFRPTWDGSTSSRKATGGKTLLCKRIPKQDRKSMPNPDELDWHLDSALLEDAVAQLSGAPPCGTLLISRILSGFMQGWDATTSADLANWQKCELLLVRKLLASDKTEATRLAQLFARGDVMLSLRDEVVRLSKNRAAFDDDHAAFVATQVMWSNPVPLHRTLTSTLKSLGAPDVDLWHYLVATHDLTDPDQQGAVLWCLRQPSCDKATIALYFSRLVNEHLLSSPRIRKDANFRDALGDVLLNWHNGFYGPGVLAFTSPDSAEQLEAQLRLGVAELNLQAGADCIFPFPRGIFETRDGRQPRRRHIWDLNRSILTGPPCRSDYIDTRYDSDRIPA